MSGRGARIVVLGAAIAALVAFAALCCLVRAGTLDAFDVRARYWFLPPGAWGTSQRLEDVVVEVCQPAVTATVLGILAAVSALRRRSPWPLVAALGLIAAAAGAVVVVKHALAVPDIHGSTDHLGGSFPSGHMVGIVCFPGGILLLRGRRRPVAWLLVALLILLALLVAGCLLLTAVHWVTDVVAGGLLGAALLLLASQVPGWWRPPGPAGRSGT